MNAAWGVAAVLGALCLILLGLLIRRRPSATAAGAPDDTHELTRGVLDAVANMIEEAHREVAEMLAAAKSLSGKEVLSAGEQLTDLYGQSRMHANDIHSLSQSVLGVLNSHAEQQAKIADEMTEKVAEIMNIVSSIERISEDAYLLGVNARIEAAHAGEAGRGFAVVAQSLQDMNKDVNRALGRIDRLSADLKEIIPSWRRGESSGVSIHSEAENSLRKGISNAEARSASILEKLNEALVHLQFQDRIMQQLDAAERLSAVPMQTVRETLNRLRYTTGAAADAAQLRHLLQSARDSVKQDRGEPLDTGALNSSAQDEGGGDVQFF